MMMYEKRKVVPYIGTWIETGAAASVASIPVVVPYIGTWIETSSLVLPTTVHASYLI